ncbi:hypothetical protein Hanom_Chr16g01422081 [Helianthus anomalus]
MPTCNRCNRVHNTPSTNKYSSLGTRNVILLLPLLEPDVHISLSHFKVGMFNTKSSSHETSKDKLSSTGQQP